MLPETLKLADKVKCIMVENPFAAIDAATQQSHQAAPATDLRQDVDHLRRALRQARSELIAVEAERDGLLAAMRHLAAPVIPISDQVVVMPLLGDAHAQRAQAHSLVLRQTTEQAHMIDTALHTIALDAEELAACARALFVQEAELRQGVAWDARQAMFRSTEGQFVNGANDLLSVFVPSWATVDDALLDELNITAALGPVLKVKRDRQPNTLCTYIFAEHCRYMAMYPNSDPNPEHPGGFLADEFPPDFGAEGDPVFWTIAHEAVNAARTTRWTAAYFDNAGSGLMVSAIAPIYVGDAATPRAMIGIDVSMARIAAIVNEAAKNVQRAAVLVDEQGHLVVASEQAATMLGLPRAAEGSRGAALGIDLAAAKHVPAAEIDAMRRGETGVQALRIGGTDMLMAYAPVPTVGWSLGVITSIAGLSVDNGATFVAQLINGIGRYRARVAVLDATGVVSIDLQTVQRIVEAVQTARLLGTDVLLAGITPAVAQMILAVGGDLTRLHCFPDLRTALRAASR